MPSYSRYSHHARRALTHAGLLVTRFRHPRVDTGHLLVGVMLAKGSIGHKILQELDLDARSAEPHLAALTMPIDQPAEDPPYDAALDIALELAADESMWLGHHYIGTEHLLLGITRTNVGNASDLLHRLGVPPEQVRHKVRRALSDGLTEFSLQLARRNARLSELSRRVINAAEQLAVSMDHPTVGLGHLLLVMMRERRSLTYGLLLDNGLDETQIQQALNAEEEAALVSIEDVLLEAVEQAQNLGSHYTGTEHLLFALVLNGNGAALLRQFDISPDELRRKVEESLRCTW